MRRFKHINALSAKEATSVLKEYGDKARVIAGGTDLVGQMKDNILPEHPEVVVNIKTISDLDYIREEGQTLKLGALTRLEDIAQDKIVKDGYSILAEAARRTASPHPGWCSNRLRSPIPARETTPRRGRGFSL